MVRTKIVNSQLFEKLNTRYLSRHSSQSRHLDLLALVPNLGAGHNVRLGVAPLVVRNSGVVGGVDAGNLEKWRWVPSSRSLNLQLIALNIELRLSNMALVKPDVLNADKVLSWWDRLGDSELNAVLLPQAPGSIISGAAAANALLPCFEPIAGAVIVGNRARSLGHINEARAGMLNELVVEELEAEDVAGLDGVGSCASGLCALVAAQLIGSDDVICEGRVVGVAVLPDVGIFAADGLAVDDEAVEDVVGLCDEGRREQGDETDGLHVGEGGAVRRIDLRYVRAEEIGRCVQTCPISVFETPECSSH